MSLIGEISARLTCGPALCLPSAYVVAGYPERADPPLASGKGYNSAIVVSPTGEVVHNYRKTFLYETDKTWAAEGTFPPFQD